MKKFAILALAALLVVAFTVPAAALENEFGGNWRTRFTSQGHYGGDDGDDGSWRYVDTRTRLNYTAKINDNLRFVNVFEFGDQKWGDETLGARQYTDVGADGVAVEIKHSYARFNLGPVDVSVGVQPYLLFRTAYVDDDAAGIIARWKVLENFVLAGAWLKAYEGGTDGGNNDDADSYTLTAAFWFNENISIKPSINWIHSTEAGPAFGAPGIGIGEADIYTYGFDFDMTYDNFGVYATAFAQSGDAENASPTGQDLDFKGYLALVGGNVMLGPVDIHGQFIYGSGDDDPADNDQEGIFADSAAYYWAEIMGWGIFDQATPENVPTGNLANLMAIGGGVTFQPMDKLSVTADLWYAKLNEDITLAGNTEDELGTELDLIVTYQLLDGLKLDLVGAYLWAGDAISTDGNNDEDPYELGARLSLSF
jgi:hypothetical protein